MGSLTGTDNPNDEDDGIVSDDLGTGHGIEVCAFDNRGMGRSSVPTHKSEYTTTIMAKDSITLLDHLGWERAHIIGHSMGAMIACKLLLEAEPMHRFENGAEEMKEDVKADKDWLTEFEHNYWSDVLTEKEKLKEQETVEACSQQSDSLSVADYGWPNDLDQSQWDPSEMLDVDELLGDINDDVFTGLNQDQDQYLGNNAADGSFKPERQQGGFHSMQCLDYGDGLPPFQLEAKDGSEFFADLSFLDLEN